MSKPRACHHLAFRATRRAGYPLAGGFSVSEIFRRVPTCGCLDVLKKNCAFRGPGTHEVGDGRVEREVITSFVLLLYRNQKKASMKSPAREIYRRSTILWSRLKGEQPRLAPLRCRKPGRASTKSPVREKKTSFLEVSIQSCRKVTTYFEPPQYPLRASVGGLAENFRFALQKPPSEARRSSVKIVLECRGYWLRSSSIF